MAGGGNSDKVSFVDGGGGGSAHSGKEKATLALWCVCSESGVRATVVASSGVREAPSYLQQGQFLAASGVSFRHLVGDAMPEEELIGHLALGASGDYTLQMGINGRTSLRYHNSLIDASKLLHGITRVGSLDILSYRPCLLYYAVHFGVEFLPQVSDTEEQ